jgi:hypothetical protein
MAEHPRTRNCKRRFENSQNAPAPIETPKSRVSTLEVNSTLIHYQAMLQNSHEVSGGNGSMAVRMERLVLLFNYADE